MKVGKDDDNVDDDRITLIQLATLATRFRMFYIVIDDPQSLMLLPGVPHYGQSNSDWNSVSSVVLPLESLFPEGLRADQTQISKTC